MRVVISNFGAPFRGRCNFTRLWRHVEEPPPLEPRDSLMDLGIADRVEFWDYQPERTMRYLPNGVLRLTVRNERDVAGYLNRFGPPDLFVNYGARGISVLALLEGQTFRVHVPCYRTQPDLPLQVAECYLVDAEEQLNGRSGDKTSNPAAMWECVAAGLPIVVNDAICGGKHLVVPGVTGELAPEGEFLDVMRMVLAHADTYKPREYFEANFDTVRTIERHLAFFREMGWQAV